MKVCTACKQTKPFADYNKDASKKDGLKSACCDCLHAKDRVYREKTKASKSIYQKQWAAKNRDKLSFSSRKWYASNRAKASQIAATWRKTNKSFVVKYTQNRRGRLSGSYTVLEWIEVKVSQRYLCLACGKRKPLTVDHVIPISKGGTNTIDNIQGLCGSCNSSKRTKTTDYRKGKT